MDNRADELTHATLRRRLLACIDARLNCPDLKPMTAAQALGASVRTVHLLLQGTPHTFSRLVARRRLQRAQALLMQEHASVVDVAYACGFNSLATFYRQYRAAFGMSPAGRCVTAGSSTEVLRQRLGDARNEKTGSARRISLQASNLNQRPEEQAVAFNDAATTAAGFDNDNRRSSHHDPI